jgi:hypothetical protein
MPEKTVAEKLLMRPGYRVAIVNPPSGYLDLTGKLPEKATKVELTAGNLDFIQAFVTSRKELEESLSGLKAALKRDGLLWVTYPKGTSKAKTDINRDSINAYAQTAGLQGVAMISVDDTWSALRLRPKP